MSMKWLTMKLVPISKLWITEDIVDRTREPRVVELAGSFDADTAGEPGNPVWLRQRPGKRSYEVVAGRDRVAACLLRERKKIWARIGEFDERAMKRARIAEGLFRRPEDRSALLAEYAATK